MSPRFGRREMRVFLRNCLIVLLVDLLAFPPGLSAAGITWNGGSGSYSDSSQWTCALCSTSTYPDNSNTGGPFDAVINSGGTDVVNLDISGAIVDSMSIGGSGPSNSSTLNIINGNALTFGTPSVSSGNALAISNGGILNINGGGSATIELSGGAGALNDTGGKISVTDGGTLTLQNNTDNGGSTFTDNGNISVIGSGTAAQLVLSANPPAGATFTLGGNGTLTLGGLGQLIDTNGVESLNNGASHTIAGDGLVSVQANFANAGTLHASTAGASLIVTSNNLTNWNGGSGTLTGGSYVVDNGATLQLSNIGTGNSIQSLNSANVSVTGTGLLTGGGATNALSGLTNLTDANLTLSGVTGLTITPGTGVPGTGTLTVTSDANGSASLVLDQASNVTVNGSLHNLTSTDTAPNTGTLTLDHGSTLTVSGNLLNEGDVNGNFQPSTSLINVLNGSTLNVDSLTTSTNNGFANSTINITGSSLNVTHDLLQGTAGPNYSGGGDTLNLTNSSATVGGNFANNNGLNASIVNLNSSSLTVDGNFTQAQANGGFGQSQLNLTSGSTMTVGGLTNSNGVGTDGITPQSQISITGASSLTVLGTGTFTNVSGGGVLSGGSYLIDNGSSLNYTGASINTIDTGTVVTLDNAGDGAGGQKAILNGGNDAITGSLTNLNGTLALRNGTSLTLAGAAAGSFSVGSAGTLSLQNGSGLDVTAYNFTNVSSGVLSGGTYFIGSNSNLNYAASQGAISTIDAATSLTLDNSFGGNQGSITYGGTDALSNSLTTNNGNLTLQNGAGLTLAQGLTNSASDTPGGPATANLLLINGSVLNLSDSASDLTNSATSSNGNDATSTVSLGGGSSLTVNNLTNTATNTGFFGGGSATSGLVAVSHAGFFGGNAVANINLAGESSLTVNGNLLNSANGFGNASALIALDSGSSLTVGGTFSNTSASLELDNGSTATITGLFTNDFNSTVNLDLTGSGGSILTTNGGFSNAGAVALNFNSTLNNTGTFANSGTVNLFGVSTLTSTGLFDNSNGNLYLNGGGNTLFAAGFTNTGGNLFVAAGDTADFRTGGLDTFTNLSNGTLTAGSYNIGGTFDFDASAGSGGGQFQTITGASVVINGTGQILYGVNGSQSDALAAVTNMELSTLSFNDAGAHTITPVPAGGGSILTLTDSNLNLSSTSAATQTNLTIAGDLTNNSVIGNGQINVIASNLTVDGTLTNSANISQSSTINLSSSFLDGSSVLTGSTLTVTGALNNGSDGFVFLNGGGNVLTAAGLTNNGAISVGAGDTADFRTGGLDTYTNLANGTLTGGALNVSGNFFYDASAGTGGGQILNMQGTSITLQGAGQLLYGPNGSQADALAAVTGITNSTLELDSLNASRTITPGGGTLTLTNGALTVNSSTLEIAGSVVMNPNNNGFVSGSDCPAEA